MARSEQLAIDLAREPGRAYLMALTGSRAGSVLRVLGQTRIGRDPQAELRLHDEAVSRYHAVLEPCGEGVRLRDLGGRNGTYVNGARVSEVILEDGDTVQIGTSAILKFLVGTSFDEFEDNVYRAALRDPLTHLYSRRFLGEQLGIAYRLARRHMLPMAVVVVDVDRMSLVNHGFGLSNGDRALAAFAARVIDAVREEDLAAKLDGQRFAVLCPMTPLAGAIQLAQRLRAAGDGFSPLGDLPHLRITVSCGVAALPELRASDGDALLAAAGAALEQAKALGRNRIASART